MKRITAAMFAVVALLAGCGGGEDTGTVSSSPNPSPNQPSAVEPSDDASEAVVVDIAVKGGKVTPQGDRVEVKVGQKITLHITSDAHEGIHVHSEPEHEYEVEPGDDVEKSFTIDTPGQIAVEAHHLDATIVQLVVRP
jgi:plastocyanin